MLGFDLRDLFTGRMSWRRLRVILSNLPVESAYITAVRNAADPENAPAPTPGIFGPWSQGDMLTARVGDLLEQWLWMNADPNTRGPAPRQYPRPGVEAKVKPISAEAAAYLEYKRTHQGADPPAGWVPQLA